MILAAIIISSVSFDAKEEAAEHAIARDNLAVTAPDIIDAPDVSGYILSVLAEKEAAAYFAEDETSPQNVQKRNFHLALENGAVIGASSVPAIYDAAKNDILSGTYSYDVYAASGRELSRLLAYALLDDVSDNPYIDTDKRWFDAVLTDSLSFFGGKYILSSTLTDTYENAYVLAYNRELVEESEVSADALNGVLTLEKLISYKKAAEIEQSDIFPLYISGGGAFLENSDGISVTAKADFDKGISQLMPLVELGIGNFSDGSAAFSVMTLGEVKKYRKAGVDVGILPVPKQSESDSYRCYVDAGATEFVALPAGHDDMEKISYLVYRLAFLSDGYMTSSYYEDFDGSEREMLKIIAESGVSDLSNLLGYGKVESLVNDVFFGREARPSLEYYNRKTLYEKALEIIEKRINKEN
ncbi:MAG: extracellular solute-binding protein [Clostridia bacterium]|nr:extracellular solute-binding protein [Clostridia bacterium]